MNTMLEHDREPARGLPQQLPGDEAILWQGRPEFGRFAISAFHIRKLAVYFLILVALHAVSSAGGYRGTLGFAALAGLAIGVVILYAWLASRRAMYTITDRRIVIRCGVALPISVNLPFKIIESADLRVFNDETGDIVLGPGKGHRASYLLLWPHVRMRSLVRVKPVLRAIDDAQSVATRLGEALAAHALVARELAMTTAVGPSATEKPEAPADAPARERPRWSPYPAIPLAGAVALVLLTVVSVGALRLGQGRVAAPPVVESVEAVELQFQDVPDGSVEIFDVRSGRLIHRIAPGEDGFVRATMRSLAAARTRAGGGLDTPFSLRRTQEGRLLLTDPYTGRDIDLWAFGETNAAAFSQLFFLAREPGEASPHAFADDDRHEDLASVALTTPEATP